jgi:PilZ domain
MHERRKAFRGRTFFGGEITFNRRSSTVDCLVRNLTADGALLVFDNTAIVPDKFDLTVERKERSFRARMVWRRIDNAGVEFVTENVAAEPIPLEWAKRLRDCEKEKASLRRRVEDLSTAG